MNTKNASFACYIFSLKRLLIGRLKAKNVVQLL